MKESSNLIGLFLPQLSLFNIIKNTFTPPSTLPRNVSFSNKQEYKNNSFNFHGIYNKRREEYFVQKTRFTSKSMESG